MKMIASLFAKLSGQKTYLVALAGAVYGALIALGHAENKGEIWGMIGAAGAAALRHGIQQKATNGTKNETPLPDPLPSEGRGKFAMILGAAVLMMCGGCASFSTTQEDCSYGTNGIPERKIVTRNKARTFWDAKSALASFTATQTDKTQSTKVGSLSQESASTNITAQLEALAKILQALRPSP